MLKTYAMILHVKQNLNKGVLQKTWHVKIKVEGEAPNLYHISRIHAKVFVMLFEK